MESHRIPAVAFLSQKNCDKLNDLIAKLCSQKKAQTLNKQIDVLEANLSNIRIFDELPIFNHKLVIPQCYIKFIENLLAYAGRQTVAVPVDIVQLIATLKKRLELLEEKFTEIKEQINAEEEARHTLTASPRRLNIAILRPTHSRTISGLGRLITNLAALEKDQKLLLAKMAEVANGMIEQSLLLPVIDEQLKQLSVTEVDNYCITYFDLKAIKNIDELNLRCSKVNDWLQQNEVILMSLKDSSTVINAISDLIFIRLPERSIKHYKALDEDKNNLRKYMPHSELALILINKVAQLLNVKQNIKNWQTERTQQIETKEEKKRAISSNMPTHRRERSKSHNHVMLPGTKITFFTSHLKKHGESQPNLRQNSGQLPTKYRVNKEKRLSNSLSNTFKPN